MTSLVPQQLEGQKPFGYSVCNLDCRHNHLVWFRAPMRHTTTIILCAALLPAALAGCSPGTGDYTTYRLSTSDIVTVQNVVRTSVKDPSSAQFGEMVATRDKTGIVRVCGLVKVNPKNSFGGYVGNSQTYIGTLTPGAFTLIKLDNPQMFGEAWPAVVRCKQNGMVLL